MKNPNQLLDDLVKALDNAFISASQRVSWQEQLDAAREYLDELKKGSE